MPDPKPFDPQDLFRIACRPALPVDTRDVMELTRTTWEGHDYIPQVWADWLADPEGLIAIAEYGGRAVGLVKLSRLGKAEWWLEGLRVHPQFKGRGFASHLFGYILDYWRRLCRDNPGPNIVRLITASDNLAVQHMCDRLGFTKIVEYGFFGADTLQETARASFTPISLDEVSQAYDIALHSPASDLTYGLIDLGYQLASPTERTIEAAVGRSMAWWWGGRLGVVIAYENPEDKAFSIQWVVGPIDQMVDCLLDFRRLSAESGLGHVRWFAPRHPDLLRILDKAGFGRDWDEIVCLYEKRCSL